MISGPTVFEGYYKDTEETEKMLVDGWLHTGDLGYIDDKRNLYVIGRLKNLIVLSNGENVSPEELEHSIEKIPGVEECMVFEETDKLCVSIYPKKEFLEELGEQVLVSFEKSVRELNQKNLSYKFISKVYVRNEPFERTATGKIKRIQNG